MDSQISIRLDVDLAERAERLAEVMQGTPDFRAFRVSRAAVLRLALQRGIEALEREYLEAAAEGGRKGRE